MTIEASVWQILADNAGVGALCEDRIYPVKVPQNATFPCVTYSRVSTNRWSAMGSDTGIADKRFQVSSWGETYAEANALAEAVRAALQRYRGTVDGVLIQDIFVDGDGPETWEDEAGAYQAVTDYRVIYEE